MRVTDPYAEFKADVCLATNWVLEKLIPLALEGKFPKELLPLYVTGLAGQDLATGRRRNLVVIHDDAHGFSKRALMGIIAHEVGHMSLDLQGVEVDGSLGQELEADRLAAGWGFSQHILKFLEEHDNKADEKGWIRLPRERHEAMKAYRNLSGSGGSGEGPAAERK